MIRTTTLEEHVKIGRIIFKYKVFRRVTRTGQPTADIPRFVRYLRRNFALRFALRSLLRINSDEVISELGTSIYTKISIPKNTVALSLAVTYLPSM